jgi:hypothetical protein
MLVVAGLFFAAGCARATIFGRKGHLLQIGLLLLTLWIALHVLRLWLRDVLGSDFTHRFGDLLYHATRPGLSLYIDILWVFAPSLLVGLSYSIFLFVTSDALARGANLKTAKGIILVLVFLGFLNGVFVLLPLILAQRMAAHGHEKLSFVLFVLAASNTLLVVLALSQLIVAALIAVNWLLLSLVRRFSYQVIEYKLLLDKKLIFSLLVLTVGAPVAAVSPSLWGHIKTFLKALEF